VIALPGFPRSFRSFFFFFFFISFPPPNDVDNCRIYFPSPATSPTLFLSLPRLFSSFFLRILQRPFPQIPTFFPFYEKELSLFLFLSPSLPIFPMSFYLSFFFVSHSPLSPPPHDWSIASALSISCPARPPPLVVFFPHRAFDGSDPVLQARLSSPYPPSPILFFFD